MNISKIILYKMDLGDNIVIKERFPDKIYATVKEIKNAILKLRSWGVTSHFVLPSNVTSNEFVFNIPSDYVLYTAENHDKKQIKLLETQINIAGFNSSKCIYIQKNRDFDISRAIVTLYSKGDKVVKFLDEKQQQVIDKKIIEDSNIPVLLGKGTYGKVYTSSDKNIVIKETSFVATKIQSPALTEYAVLEILKGEKNILQLRDMKFSPTTMDLYLDRCETSLEKMLEMKEVKTMELKMQLIRNISKGIYNIHKYGLRHRDLKPDNILVNRPSTVFISDFGGCDLTMMVSKPFENDTSTPLWAAPEIVRKMPSSNKIDIWSLGIIFIQILLNSVNTLVETVNVDRKSMEKMIAGYTTNKIRTALSKINNVNLVNLILRMMQADEKLRCNIEDVLAVVYPEEKFSPIDEKSCIENLRRVQKDYPSPSERKVTIINDNLSVPILSKLTNYEIYSQMTNSDKDNLECCKFIETRIRTCTYNRIEPLFFDRLKRMVKLLGANMILPSPYEYLTENKKRQTSYIKIANAMKKYRNPYDTATNL